MIPRRAGNGSEKRKKESLLLLRIACSEKAHIPRASARRILTDNLVRETATKKTDMEHTKGTMICELL